MRGLKIPHCHVISPKACLPVGKAEMIIEYYKYIVFKLRRSDIISPLPTGMQAFRVYEMLDSNPIILSLRDYSLDRVASDKPYSR